MNNRFLTTMTMLTGSLFLAACSDDNSSYETPASNSETPAISGVVAQKNLSVLPEDTQPKIYDENGKATDTTLSITAKIGDKDNQLLTDAHTIYFATEWGLINRSCVTVDGECSVNWQTSFGPGTVPSDHRVTIVAYTLGEENFTDSNGNGIFDDSDSAWEDREEPYVDADENGSFDQTIDTMLDVMDGVRVGQNGVHDSTGDGYMNSPSCTHSSLCSTEATVIYIWDESVINMDGPPVAPTTP